MGQTSPPAPSPHGGEGVQRSDRGRCMALDGGLRCNDQCLGAMNHAPTKNLPLSALWSPRCAGGGAQHVAPLRLGPCLPQSVPRKGLGVALPVLH